MTKAIQAVLQDFEKLEGEIYEINEIKLKSNSNIQSVAVAFKEQNAAMEEVAAASTYLAKMAVELAARIGSDI